MIDAVRAERFARAALANVTREYPRMLDDLLDAPPTGDLKPRANHPAFYGSYDWHSAVHMHWLLVRLLRTHPDLPSAGQMMSVLDAHLAPGPLAAERAFFDTPGGRTFERPYGWAWLLDLQAEALRMAGGRPAARRWAQALAPHEFRAWLATFVPAGPHHPPIPRASRLPATPYPTSPEPALSGARCLRLL